MENLLTSISESISDDATITTNSVNFHHSFNTGGTVTIQKGKLSIDVSFYANLYESQLRNTVDFEEFEITDYLNVTLGGIPIDNIDVFLASLRRDGMTTIANKLTLSDIDIKIEISKKLEEDKVFKAVFGKKTIVLSRFTNTEKENYYVQYAIDNYSSELFNLYNFSRFKVELRDPETDLILGSRIPTIQELNAKLV